MADAPHHTELPLPEPDEDTAFENLLRFIHQKRAVDFRGYKRSSLRRRISLRMEQLLIARFTGYQAFLAAHPPEFAELLNTVLINVTSFFRDPQAWQALHTEFLTSLPENGREQLRVWSIGCATGEEPYSVAILLSELLGPLEFRRRVKIYATDLDDTALNRARHASYRPRDVEGIPEDLLSKYFERTNNHYMVRSELRNAVIFGRHNIVHDSPISRIDLLLCRNLLIYLEAETQNQVLPRLHYALRNDGCLFLGRAETQLARSSLFEPMDMDHRLFRKVPQELRRARPRGDRADRPDDANVPLHARLLQSIVDSSVSAYLAIDSDDVLLYASGGARRMLDVNEHDIGRSFHDLPISHRPVELHTQINDARRQRRALRIEHLTYHRPPAPPVRLTVDLAPLTGNDGNVFAVLLTFTDTTHLFTLQQELTTAQESLETTIEELQSTNEELETTNEELQSTNEELEATNEELEATNEELVATNEELRSTNQRSEKANEILRQHYDEIASYRHRADAVLRILDAGIVVIDPYLKVQFWNRWNENTWGLRAEEVVGTPMLELDIGLPMKLLEEGVRRAIAQSLPTDITVDAIHRLGQPIKCRIRMTPLVQDNHGTQGAVLLVEDAARRA